LKHGGDPEKWGLLRDPDATRQYRLIPKLSKRDSDGEIPESACV
jgi:hypothetical protein